MRIFYNEHTHQLIVSEADYAISVYLQADETPTKKAADLVDIYAENPTNVSVCKQVILDNNGQLLPDEEAPQPELNPDNLEPKNDDNKKE